MSSLLVAKAKPAPSILQVLENPQLLPVTDVRQEFKKVLDNAARGEQAYVLVSHSTPKAVLISYETFVALRKQLAGDIYRAMRHQSRSTMEPSDTEMDSAIQEALQVVRKRYA